MKTDEIMQTIKDEVSKLSPHIDYNFSIDSKWKQGTTIELGFRIAEPKDKDGTLRWENFFLI